MRPCEYLHMSLVNKVVPESGYLRQVSFDDLGCQSSGIYPESTLPFSIVQVDISIPKNT